tara:strand:- start:1136 stop:1993 length:858 start_codon:yes stop_codon:yes gene_type:complete
MADKKITALTALDSTGKDPTDLLHIIDFSASPVNKKITLANLFARIDTPVSSVGTSNFEFGPTTAISAFKVDIPNATPAGSAESTVVVNENGNAFIDFRVETKNSAQAIFVDSSDDTGNGDVNYVKINGDSAKVDFQVYSDTGILVHSDAPNHSVGIGTDAPSASFMLDVIADASTGGSINSAGWLALSGSDTRTGAGAVSIDKPVTFLSNSSGVEALTIANGTAGQIKILVMTVKGGTSMRFTGQSNMLFAGGNTLTFDAVGETAILMYVNSKWTLISGTASVS